MSYARCVSISLDPLFTVGDLIREPPPRTAPNAPFKYDAGMGTLAFNNTSGIAAAGPACSRSTGRKWRARPWSIRCNDLARNENFDIGADTGTPVGRQRPYRVCWPLPHLSASYFATLVRSCSDRLRAMQLLSARVPHMPFFARVSSVCGQPSRPPGPPNATFVAAHALAASSNSLRTCCKTVP